jgi:hypothetical protein
MGGYMGGETMNYTKKGATGLLPIATAALGALSAITFTHISNLFAKLETEVQVIPVPYEVEKVIYVDKIVEIEKPFYIEKVLNISIPYEVEKLIYMDKIINIPVPTPYEVEKTIYVDKFIEVPVEVEKIVYVDRVLIQPHDSNDFNSPCF